MRRLFLISMALCTFLACDSNQKEIHVGEVLSSGCKADKNLELEQTKMPGADRCVSWARPSDDSIVIGLTDFAELCDTETLPWIAKAQFDGPETIHLFIEWSFKTPNACGLCEHDFSLTLSGAQFNQVKTLNLSTRGCSGDCTFNNYKVDLFTSDKNAPTKLCGDSVPVQ